MEEKMRFIDGFGCSSIGISGFTFNNEKDAKKEIVRTMKTFWGKAMFGVIASHQEEALAAARELEKEKKAMCVLKMHNNPHLCELWVFIGGGFRGPDEFKKKEKLPVMKKTFHKGK
jgi:hypothetical protein